MSADFWVSWSLMKIYPLCLKPLKLLPTATLNSQIRGIDRCYDRCYLSGVYSFLWGFFFCANKRIDLFKYLVTLATLKVFMCFLANERKLNILLFILLTGFIRLTGSTHNLLTAVRVWHPGLMVTQSRETTRSSSGLIIFVKVLLVFV